ncbi:20421_t:CDS:2 [Gigaspora rosea]|nr:20421_t:CDS:2 [Gigaspora rosea]
MSGNPSISINNSTISGNVGNVQGIVSKRKVISNAPCQNIQTKKQRLPCVEQNIKQNTLQQLSSGIGTRLSKISIIYLAHHPFSKLCFQQDSLETIERSLRLNSAGLSGDLLTRAFFKLLKECILWDLSTNIDELTEGIFMIDFIAPLFNKTIHYFNYTTTHSWIDVESKASKLRRWYGRCPDYKLNNKDGTITGVFAEVTSPRRKDDEQKIYWDIYRGAIKEIDQDIKQNEICPDEAKRIIISSSDLK